MLAKGYTDPELSAGAFDDDGYFRTGDRRPPARRTATSCSPVALKDMIIRKGENISPRRSRTCSTTHPKVADVAVIGLPDRERGERVCAVVRDRRTGRSR